MNTCVLSNTDDIYNAFSNALALRVGRISKMVITYENELDANDLVKKLRKNLPGADSNEIKCAPSDSTSKEAKFLSELGELTDEEILSRIHLMSSFSIKRRLLAAN